ncbi:MAG: DUF2269 family protein [Gemmatimonadales bacterium]|jgi:uncharacterized membrane protein|nr:MAG: DUF2269 family protein [Gemmatimonadales bacterium]
MNARESRNEVMERAIRRLGILEHLFIGLAAVAALVAGALVAWLLGQAFGLSFRPTWAVSALLLFILPGGISIWRVRRHSPRIRAEDSAEHSRDRA